MSIDLEQIEAIRAQAIQHLLDLLANSGPTITINGEEAPWAPLLQPLEGTIDWCDNKLAGYDPFEVRSRAHT